MYRRQIQEGAVNDTLGRVKIFQQERHVLARRDVLGPLKVALKLRGEVRVEIGQHAEKSPQLSKKRMLQNVLAPFVARLGLRAFSLHPVLPPGSPMLLIEPLHVVL